VPFVCQPRAVLLAIDQRIVGLSLLPLWLLGWNLVFVEDRCRPGSLVLKIVLILPPRGFVVVLLELFSGLAEELQVDNDIGDELHKPVSLLVLKVLCVLLIVHFEADGGDVIIGYWGLAFFASLPAVVELLDVLEGADHVLVSGLTADEAQSTFGLQVSAAFPCFSHFRFLCHLYFHLLVCWYFSNYFFYSCDNVCHFHLLFTFAWYLVILMY